ncbi:hypothetical protein Calag_0421 [Caldisphaera lagunensis DSM 15908]|uniref:GTP-dependent dephospho-CoA kinase n=1 Tax=Caldisphaera lagunensis (strain DSM 15908 / JCM 11604 / ANMR 0165 / IC-154) TaxID=1056495 RepID=L0AAY6_CALLD|nr:GTP-dependent dephospho-CoA kinase family protein [Caldisphaera lagunensis]AFZ70190.1 hypothetical protein Calag_0421 [Caldisphaera lagunensis DSM 15908]
MKFVGLTLPENVRYDFSQPRGRVISGELKSYIESREWNFVICVGDVVTYYCLKANRKPDIIIIDGKTLRSKEGFSFDSNPIDYNLIKIKNPPGMLTYDNIDLLCNILKSKNKEKILIYVDGEEDLLALPTLSCAQDNSLVIYGIPNKGAALVNVNNYIRRELQNKILVLKPGIIETK